MIKINYLSFLLFLSFLPTMAWAQKHTSQNILVNKVGTLISIIPPEEAKEVKELKISGTLNATDFMAMRTYFTNLEVLDIEDVFIRNYVGKNGPSSSRVQTYMNNVLPSYSFTEVTDYTVSGMDKLRKVTLPTGLKSIGKFAFANCPNLEVVVITSPTPPSLGVNALSAQRTAIFVKTGTKDSFVHHKDWEDFAIMEDRPVQVQVHLEKGDQLDQILLKKGVQPNRINYLKLSGSIEEDELKLIRDYMPNLVKVCLADTDLTVITDYTFSHKVNLLSIELPKKLEVIGFRAFDNCSRLGPILTLPASVTTIMEAAFNDCKQLESVVITGKVESLSKKAFGFDTENRFIMKNN